MAQNTITNIPDSSVLTYIIGLLFTICSVLIGWIVKSWRKEQLDLKLKQDKLLNYFHELDKKVSLIERDLE